MLELPVAAARQLASQLNRQEASDHERAIYDDKGVPDQLNNKNHNSKSSAAASPSAVAAAKAADAEKAAPDEATAVVADATTAAAAEATTADSALAGTAAEATESAAAPMDTPAEATMGVVAAVRGEQDSAAAAATSPSVQGLIGIDREMTEAGAKETIIKEVASTLLPSPSVASAVHLAAGNSGDSSASSSSSTTTTTTTSNKRRATASVSTSSSNNRTTSSAPPQKLQSNNKEVRQRSAVADGVATVCVFKISAADEPNRAYFGFTAAQAFHAMFKRVCEARREALLKLVQAHTTHLAPAAPSAPNAKAPADDAATATASDGENANMALGVKGAEKGSKTATSSTAQKDARAWLVPRVFGRRSAFASFGLTPAQWFGFGVALVQRRLETLPCVADLAVLPKLPPPSFIANARAAAAAAASAAAATTSTSASARSPAQDIEIAEVAAATAAAAAWPPRYRCRFVKPTSDAVLSAVRALAARDARVKPNPSGCARAESRSNVASATARSKRVTRELHSGGNGGEGDGDSTSGGASGAAAGGARRGARAKTTGSGDSEDNRGSRSGLHVRNDSTSDEVRACACFNELAIVDISE